MPPARVAAAALLAAGLMVGVAACSDDGGAGEEVTVDDDGPNRGALPTLPGGVDLAERPLATLLVGTGLAFGTPLPSEQAAADVIAEAPEVAAATARRVYAVEDGRHMADALFLTLDGAEIFDARALDAFERAMVRAIGGGKVTDAPVAGRSLRRSWSGDLLALAFRQDSVLVVVSGTVVADVERATTLQLEALGRGDLGSELPATPIISTPVATAFVEVPTVTFAAFRPPEDETPPPPPGFLGADAIEGRYGVVAGERRTVVWAIAVSPAAYPSAEVLDPVLPEVVAGRAGGTAPVPREILDRVALVATSAPGMPSAALFRHRGLVLIVEGDRPDQVEAVVTAWITALGPT